MRQRYIVTADLSSVTAGATPLAGITALSVVDALGLEAAERSWWSARPAGWAASRSSSPLTGVQAGPGRFPVMAAPDASALERLAGLLGDGSLRVPIQRSYSLEEAGEALGSLPTTHTQGKLAIAIA